MKTLLLSASFLLGLTSMSPAAIYNGNGNSGFGGVIGTGSLELTDNGTTLSGTVTKGSGDFNDAFVIYFDSVSGGFTTTSGFTDNGGGTDANRAAISALGTDGTRETINFNTGFGADYAISLIPNGADFGGLWQLVDGGSHNFVTSVNLLPVGTTTSATYTFDFDFADIGLVTAGGFEFVVTYLNAGNAFLSDEGVGWTTAGGNPGNGGAFNLNGQETYVVPEPAAYAGMIALGILGLAILRRQR